MQKHLCSALLLLTTLVPPSFAQSVPPPPQGTQTDAAFVDSFKSNHVTNVFATAQKISCYTPEVPYAGNLGPTNGYTGEIPCNGSANTGEDLGPYLTQNIVNQPQLVNNHSESDLRVDPTNSNHLIEQTKWFVSAEGYNHLQGFYESFDGGKTWSAQGHIPGYEGFTDNTDPVGAFDAFGNYHALLLPYQFSYDKFGFQVFNNGSSLPNSALPGEAISSAVRPHGAISATDWNFTHNGSLDYLMTAPNAHSNDPDKQWITVDLNPSSPHYNRIYAMWTLFAFNPSSVFVSFSDANADGSHTDWSTPTVLPTINGHPWDNYMLPHVTPDGTVYTQPGLAKLILWIRSMTSRDTEGRPSGWRLFHFQYSRNPFRCQAMTVSGLTMTNADRQPLHSRESHTHRNRSAQLRRSRWLRGGALEDQELMPEGKNLSLKRCSSLKGLPS